MMETVQMSEAVISMTELKKAMENTQFWKV